jgi:hypothetical protein
MDDCHFGFYKLLKKILRLMMSPFHDVISIYILLYIDGH